MVEFKSDLSVDKLSERWDEYTSPSRFAGSDDTMDLIFMAKRKGVKVRLVRKARNGREPFCCVFRGILTESEGGSIIKGFFTKSVFDYTFITVVIALLFYIRYLVMERGESLNTVNILLACVIIGGILLLHNGRSTKRIYADFIARITGGENGYFLTKSEISEKENNEDIN